MAKTTRLTTVLAAAALGTTLALMLPHQAAGAQDTASPTSWQALVEEARKAVEATEQATADDGAGEAQARLLRDAFEGLVSAMAALDAKLAEAADAKRTEQQMAALAQRISVVEAEAKRQGETQDKLVRALEGIVKAQRQPQAAATTGQASAGTQGVPSAPAQGGPVKLTMFAQGSMPETFSVMNTSGRCVQQWSAVLRYTALGSKAPLTEQRISARRLEHNRPVMLKKGEYGETEPLNISKFVYYADPEAELLQSIGRIGYTVTMTDQRWKECG